MSPVVVEVRVTSVKSPILAAAIRASALVFVKYKLVEPSAISSVSWLLTSETVPVTFPVKLPSKVPATNVSEPTVHLSSVSFHKRVLFAEVPLSISIPPSSVGVPVTLLFKTIVLSSTVNVSVFNIVWVPLTVKSPVITTLLLTVNPLNVTESDVPKPKESLAVEPLSTVQAEPLETIKAPFEWDSPAIVAKSWS